MIALPRLRHLLIAAALLLALPAHADTAPLRVEPVPTLRGMAHRLPIASAQVKSALVLAGLAAEGETRVREPEPSRDHTERMLGAWGAPVRVDRGEVVATRLLRPLSLPGSLEVPGDPSSAAFWVGAGLLVPGGSIVVRGVGVNPTRTGFLAVLQRMGARVVLEPETARHVQNAFKETPLPGLGAEYRLFDLGCGQPSPAAN